MLCLLSPKLPEFTCAASLAHHGLLGLVSTEVMRLDHVDLTSTSVPPEHLASLISRATENLFIRNVSGCDLVIILYSVKSTELEICNQSLDSEETQALVQAMESGVESVGLSGEVALDIRSLMDYSGQGKCRGVWCYSDSVDRYREQLRTWASSQNWEVGSDKEYIFSIVRSGEV